jgi:hypothetical protein
MAIDPHLVDSPSASDFDADDQNQGEEPALKKTRSATKAASKPEEKDETKLAVTIAPVKVGGHGKARKGTVQSGGITKKVATASTAPAPIPVPVSVSPPTHSISPSYFPSTSAATLSGKENFSSQSSNAAKSDKGSDDKDDDDDLPADWRPPPEVFAKMTSKEKRQLRNKISARNFRVRRKEYISTLEMDIAERDRLLQAIRSELGSTQSENLALRQEVAALKRALLEGRQPGAVSSAVAPLSPTSLGSSSPTLNIRGADVNLNSAAVTLDDLNLPPPAPLPDRSAAEELAARAAAASASASSPSSSSSPHLLTPNTQKDLPTSSRVNAGAGFWGGISQTGFGGFGAGGYTPVHTVLMPDLNMHTETNLSIGQWVRDVVAANAAAAAAEAEANGRGAASAEPRVLQENMNPTMNGQQQQGQEMPGMHAFDGFVDTNPFTMKTLDAYRMHLWTKMAASSSSSHNNNPIQQQQQQQQQQHLIQQQQHYAQQRKALERESLAPSPFTLPSHQAGAQAHPNAHGITHPHPHLNGLATSLKPAYFVNSNKPNLPMSTFTRSNSTLSALLAGKHSTPSAFGSAFLGSNTSASASGVYPSPPSSPNLSGKTLPSSSSTRAAAQQSPSSSSKHPQGQPLTPAQMQQAQNAMYAAALASTASQTLLGKLGSAFWDAFSGSSSHPATTGTSASSTSGSGSGSGAKPWDVDKVRKVLEGKAVVRVVDVDEPVSSSQPTQPKVMMKSDSKPQKQKSQQAECSMMALALLEESMRSLTLAKK